MEYNCSVHVSPGKVITRKLFRVRPLLLTESVKAQAEATLPGSWVFHLYLPDFEPQLYLSGRDDDSI